MYVGSMQPLACPSVVHPERLSATLISIWVNERRTGPEDSAFLISDFTVRHGLLLLHRAARGFAFLESLLEIVKRQTLFKHNNNPWQSCIPTSIVPRRAGLSVALESKHNESLCAGTRVLSG